MRGGIISGWLVKVVLGIALAGVLCMEAGALIETRVAVADIADNAAAQAVQAAGARGGTVQAAREAAASYAQDHGGTLTGFSTNATGIHVRVQKQARTLVIRRVRALRHWALVSGDGSATFAT
jgi:hypothetical protein